MKQLDHKMLSDGERELVLAGRPKELRKLDEDELIDLHRRVRRARNKYSKLYRRRAGEQVGADRARGKASKKQKKVAAKAEIFEDLLSEVSGQLSVVAHDNAERLRAERLAAASKQHRGSAARGPGDGAETGGKGPGSKGSNRARERSPIEKKKNASNRGSKRRHQARKAGR